MNKFKIGGLYKFIPNEDIRLFDDIHWTNIVPNSFFKEKEEIIVVLLDSNYHATRPEEYPNIRLLIGGVVGWNNLDPDDIFELING